MSDFQIMDDSKGGVLLDLGNDVNSENNDDSEDLDDSFSNEEPEHEEIEEAPEEIEEEEPEEEPRPLKIPKTRNQIQRERIINEELARVARAEADALRQENERLRHDRDAAQHMAMQHYDTGIEKDYNQVKHKLAIAIENGDVDAQVEANAELSRLSSQKHEADNWKIQRQIESERAQRQSPRDQGQPSLPKAAIEWYSQNTWANPNSPDFDHDMFTEADYVSKQLDHELTRSGHSHLIYSRAYFNKINELVEERVNPQRPTQRKELNMKPTRNGVAPVKSSGFQGNTAKSSKKESLSAAQADFIRGTGIDEKEYLKQFIKDKAINPHKYGKGY